MKVSISRSVGRAFAIMELFREAREPANATQLSRRLDAPHSSVVAVLHNLRELGYLSFDETDMTYFPTTKLLDLTSWLRPAPRDHGRLGALVEAVARDTGHMVVLASRLSLFVNTITLRPGRFTTVSAPPRSVGAALTTSIHGLVILAQMGDDEVAEIMRETEAWLRDAGARKTFDTASILANIAIARRKGYLAGAHPTCRGTEIIAYAVKGAHPHLPLARQQG
jgi:DNA-binding IclR family transcriptional regulator